MCTQSDLALLRNKEFWNKRCATACIHISDSYDEKHECNIFCCRTLPSGKMWADKLIWGCLVESGSHCCMTHLSPYLLLHCYSAVHGRHCVSMEQQLIRRLPQSHQAESAFVPTKPDSKYLFQCKTRLFPQNKKDMKLVFFNATVIINSMFPLGSERWHLLQIMFNMQHLYTNR